METPPTPKYCAIIMLDTPLCGTVRASLWQTFKNSLTSSSTFLRLAARTPCCTLSVLLGTERSTTKLVNAVVGGRQKTAVLTGWYSTVCRWTVEKDIDLSLPISLLSLSPIRPRVQINSAQHIIDLCLIPFTGIKTETTLDGEKEETSSECVCVCQQVYIYVSLPGERTNLHSGSHWYVPHHCLLDLLSLLHRERGRKREGDEGGGVRTEERVRV